MTKNWVHDCYHQLHYIKPYIPHPRSSTWIIWWKCAQNRIIFKTNHKIPNLQPVCHGKKIPKLTTGNNNQNVSVINLIVGMYAYGSHESRYSQKQELELWFTIHGFHRIVNESISKKEREGYAGEVYYCVSRWLLSKRHEANQVRWKIGR